MFKWHFSIYCLLKITTKTVFQLNIGLLYFRLFSVREVCFMKEIQIFFFLLFFLWSRGVNHWDHLLWFGAGGMFHLLACRGRGGLCFQCCLHSALHLWGGRGQDLPMPALSWHFQTEQVDFLSGFSLESQHILHGKNANFCFRQERG